MKTNDQSPPERKATYSASEDSRFVDKYRSNVKSDVIEITADKLENILLKHLDNLGIRRAWTTPLSVFLTALLAILTATFSKKLGIDGPYWEAGFCLLTIAMLCYLVYTLFRLCAHWKTSSLDYLINLIKNAQNEATGDSRNLSTVQGNLSIGTKDKACNVPITGGLIMWLDASDISSLFQESDGKKPVTTGNQLVGLWMDNSENENHFLQPLHEARPLFVKTGIGGKPSIAFNTKQSIFLTRSFPAPVTVIYVAKQTGDWNNRVLSAMTNNWLLGYWSGAKNQAFYEEWVSPKGSPKTDNLPHVFSGIVRGQGRDSEVWADGAMVAINQNGITGPNGLAINTGQYSKEVSDCQVAEIIVFNRDISQSEREKVEAHLMEKWGIKYLISRRNYN